MENMPENTPEDKPSRQVPPPMETRWKPGQSGNPSGRPKGTVSLVSLLRRYCDRHARGIPWCRQIAETLGLGDLDDKKNPHHNATVADVVMASVAFHGSKGNVAAVRELLDRIDGPVAQRHELSGPGGGHIMSTTELIDKSRNGGFETPDDLDAEAEIE